MLRALIDPEHRGVSGEPQVSEVAPYEGVGRIEGDMKPRAEAAGPSTGVLRVDAPVETIEPPPPIRPVRADHRRGARFQCSVIDGHASTFPFLAWLMM